MTFDDLRAAYCATTDDDWYYDPFYAYDNDDNNLMSTEEDAIELNDWIWRGGMSPRLDDDDWSTDR